MFEPHDSEIAGEGIIVKEVTEDPEEACDGAELSHVKSADEDDDSGEEQISSALFVLWQAFAKET